MRISHAKVLPVVLLLLASLAPVCRAQEKLVGEWRGTISFEGQDFRIAWHVVKAADGHVVSTFDNIDQGISGIKTKSMTLEAGDLVIIVDDSVTINGQETRIAGEYRGKVNKDFSEVRGTFTQSQPEEQPATELNFKRDTPGASASPPAKEP